MTLDILENTPLIDTACTIVLRGSTEQLLDEAERSLHDALAVLSQTVKEPKVTLGGGCAEMTMSLAVEQAAQNTTGKKQLGMLRRPLIVIHY